MHYYPQYNFEEHYTYLPPNWYAEVSKSRGGGRGIEITHTAPQTDVLKSPCQEVGVVLTLHIPPKADVLKSPNQEVSGVLALHIPSPPTYLFDFKTSTCWIDGGWYWHCTYPPPQNWYAQVSKSKGGGCWHYTYPPTKLMCSCLQVKRCGGYWHYTYPSPTKLMCSTILVVGSILMYMGKEGMVLITMHSNKSGVRFLFYLF